MGIGVAIAKDPLEQKINITINYLDGESEVFSLVCSGKEKEVKTSS